MGVCAPLPHNSPAPLLSAALLLSPFAFLPQPCPVVVSRGVMPSMPWLLEDQPSECFRVLRPSGERDSVPSPASVTQTLTSLSPEGDSYVPVPNTQWGHVGSMPSPPINCGSCRQQMQQDLNPKLGVLSYPHRHRDVPWLNSNGSL